MRLVLAFVLQLAIFLPSCSDASAANGKQAHLPESLLPTINAAGEMSIAATGDQEMIERLWREGWGIPIVIPYDSGLKIYIWDAKPDVNGNTDRYIVFKPSHDLGKDWVGTNIPQYLTTPDWIAQYRQALDFTREQQEAKDKNPHLNLTLTGWSLAGTIAEYLSLELGTKAITFNAGPLSLPSIFSMKDRTAQAQVGRDMIQNFTSTADPVSKAKLGFGEYGEPHTYAPVRPLEGLSGDYGSHSVPPLLDSINASFGKPLWSSSTKTQNLGGVDFTTIRLAYVSQWPSPTTVASVFSAPFVNGSFDRNLASRSYGLSASAIRAALEHPSSSFWVNLNPSEPDRIADPQLGKTDVARVLLEADLRMKKDAAAITDPRTSPVAREYWRRLRLIAGEGHQISQQTRFWIVPGRVELASSGSGVYLARADLEVRLESERFSSATAPKADTLAQADRVSRELVLPLLTGWINHASQYSELRQVYAGLIMATWCRQKYGDAALGLVPRNVNMLSDPDWTPRKTWLNYRHSVEKGEYDFSETTSTHVVHYFSGGVDFTSIPLPAPSQLDTKLQTQFEDAAASDKPILRSDGALFSAATAATFPVLSSPSSSAPQAPSESAVDSGGVLPYVATGVVLVLCLVILRSMLRRLPE